MLKIISNMVNDDDNKMKEAITVAENEFDDNDNLS